MRCPLRVLIMLSVGARTCYVGSRAVSPAQMPLTIARVVSRVIPTRADAERTARPAQASRLARSFRLRRSYKHLALELSHLRAQGVVAVSIVLLART